MTACRAEETRGIDVSDSYANDPDDTLPQETRAKEEETRKKRRSVLARSGCQSKFIECVGASQLGQDVERIFHARCERQLSC